MRQKVSPKIYVGSCSSCNGVLEAVYALEKISEEITPADLEHKIAGVWKYFEFLPLSSKSHIISLGEGGTFLHRSDRLAKKSAYKTSTSKMRQPTLPALS